MERTFTRLWDADPTLDPEVVLEGVTPSKLNFRTIGRWVTLSIPDPFEVGEKIYFGMSSKEFGRNYRPTVDNVI